MKKLGYVRISLRQSMQEIKLLYFKTYVHPLLEYAFGVRDLCTKKNIDKLENLCKKSAWFIFCSYIHLMSVFALLQRASLETSHLQWYHERLKYMCLLYLNKLGTQSSLYIGSHATTHVVVQFNKLYRNFSVGPIHTRAPFSYELYVIKIASLVRL